MKKFISLFAVFSMAVALSACGNAEVTVPSFDMSGELVKSQDYGISLCFLPTIW